MKNPEKSYPMAPPQTLLYTGEIAAAGSLLVRESNIMGFSIEVSESEHSSYEIADALEKAVNHFVRNNDTLRLRFFRQGLSWKQYIEPYRETALSRIEISDSNSFASYMNDTYIGKPNWKKDILWIGAIGLLPENGAILAMRVSHYAFDGYSIALAYRRIREAYQVYLRGETPAEKPAPSFAACLEALSAYKASEQYKTDGAYWKKAFHSLKHYSFPAGYMAMRTENASVTRYIPKELRSKIGIILEKTSCSFPFFVECAVALTVHKLSRKICFSIATLSHGRTKYTEKQTIGNMANTAPMFFTIEEGRLIDWVEKNYIQYLENVGHSRFPASAEIPFSWKEAFLHGMNFNPSWFLFSSMSYGDAKTDPTFRLETRPRVAQPYQMYGTLLDVPSGPVEVSLIYQRHKYKPEKAAVFIDTFMDILSRMAASPESDINDIIQ